MAYLQRIKERPIEEHLSPDEVRYVQEHFVIYARKVIVDGHTVVWDEIEEVEVATAPRVVGPAGWIVRHMVHGGERYHVGLYFGRQEAIVSNVTLNVTRYIVQTVAYFAPLPVRYTGSENLSPVVEE